MSIDFETTRREYLFGGLRRKDLKACPIEQFTLWMEQAQQADIKDPTAMALATVDAAGVPSQRVVLLKNLDADGFVFYTNYTSKKAADMLVNANVSLLFPWLQIDRQVKVVGTVSKVSAEESRDYFHSRPRESQLAAYASQQSSAVAGRDDLLQRYADLDQQYAEQPLPTPDFWGGYRVVPSLIEFWQGGEYRLHDRFVYTQADSGWAIERLAP